MELSAKRSRSRSHRRVSRIAAESESLGEHLSSLHKSGCPNVFLKIIYYLTHLVPLNESDLVDSVEVFSGTANYSKALQTASLELCSYHINYFGTGSLLLVSQFLVAQCRSATETFRFETRQHARYKFQ